MAVRWRCFVLVEPNSASGAYAEAITSYNAAKKAGYNADHCALAIAEAQRYMGDAVGALATLDNLFGAIEQTAEYLYQRGATVAAMGGNPGEVVALFERAVATDPRHAGALFGLALECDRRGDDDRALGLYERSVQGYPTHVGALLNLGLMYEDRQRYEQAQMCYRRILDSFPNEPRPGFISGTPPRRVTCSLTRSHRSVTIGSIRC